MCVQVLPSGTSQNLQVCMGSSRMDCQLTFLMTWPNYASRYCWAWYFQQHFHVHISTMVQHTLQAFVLGCGHNGAPHCQLFLLSYLQKPCMLEPDHERFIYNIHAAVVDLSVVHNGIQQSRQGNHAVTVNCMPDFLTLHWLLFQDNFTCSEEMTFASPVSAEHISGKISVKV